MNRRNFLRNISLSGAGALILNGLPINAFAKIGGLESLVASSTNDKVLILIQLHGGNDGLNTLVPLNQYSEYFNLRPNIALPQSGTRKLVTLDSTLAESNQIGIHPDMGGLKNLYDRGNAAIVQAVGYNNMNGSHFRSRDIWLSGSDYNETLSSGWLGRYLDNLNPTYPEGYPSATNPDPLALEIGSRVSLAFHRENGIPVAIALEDPDQFYDLVSKVGVDPSVEDFNSYYGQELRYLMEVEEKSNQYAERMQQVFDQGSNSAGVVYPEKYPFPTPSGKEENMLSSQLKTIARMLSGGCQTKVFLAKITGFDTHANQVQAGDSTKGDHAALMYNLFSAINAFQDDLRGLGLEDRVMTVTFSEFGRRAESNGSYGTDHGTAAPMFVFGKHVNPGVIGTNPDLNNLTLDKNLVHQHDYRQVFATLLQDWMGAPSEAIEAARLSEYVVNGQKLPIVAGSAVASDTVYEERYYLYDCYPNPVKDQVNIKWRIPRNQAVHITVEDSYGKTIYAKKLEDPEEINHRVAIDLTAYARGTYYYTFQSGPFKSTKRFLKK